MKDTETLSAQAIREADELKQHHVNLTAMFYLLTGAYPDELYLCCVASCEYVMMMGWDTTDSVYLFKRGIKKPIYVTF